MRESQPKELLWVAGVFEQVTTCARDKPRTPQSAPSASSVLTGGSAGPTSPAFPRTWLCEAALAPAGDRQGFSGVRSSAGDVPLRGRGGPGHGSIPCTGLCSAVAFPAGRASRFGEAAPVLGAGARRPPALRRRHRSQRGRTAQRPTRFPGRLSRTYTGTPLLEAFLTEEPALNGGLRNSLPRRDVCFQWLSLVQG